MKKSYVAPKINIEHYELTTAIAACSGVKIGLNNASCVFKGGMFARKTFINEFKSFFIVCHNVYLSKNYCLFVSMVIWYYYVSIESSIYLITIFH